MRIFLTFSLSLLLLLNTQEVMACKCTPPNPEETLKNMLTAKAVFLGKVTAIEETSKKTIDGHKYTDRKINFSVEKSWKGINDKNVSIKGEEGPCCICVGYPFREGERYIVFTESNELRVDSSCSRTL